MLGPISSWCQQAYHRQEEEVLTGVVDLLDREIERAAEPLQKHNQELLFQFLDQSRMFQCVRARQVDTALHPMDATRIDPTTRCRPPPGLS